VPWVTDIHFTDIDGGKLGDYELEEDLIYEDVDGTLYKTLKGASSDLSSFPWFARVILPKSLLAKAPFPHDTHYRTQKALVRTPEDQDFVSMPISREKSDRLYRNGAIDEGINDKLAKGLYAGLRVGGWVTWNKHKRAIAKALERRRKVGR